MLYKECIKNNFTVKIRHLGINLILCYFVSYITMFIDCLLTEIMI